MDSNPNRVFIIEKFLKFISHPVKIVDGIFLVYKQKKGEHQNTPSLISTEYLLKWSNKKELYLGIGDTCYPNFVPFAMDEFKRHIYLYYLNGVNPYPMVDMRFKSRISDPV